jgi:hypothetical protein
MALGCRLISVRGNREKMIIKKLNHWFAKNIPIKEKKNSAAHHSNTVLN